MTDIWPADPECGDLCLERDTGLVHRRAGDDLESLGYIGDPDNCPPGREAAWDVLRLWWDEAGDYGRACAAEVHRSWSAGPSIARME